MVLAGELENEDRVRPRGALVGLGRCYRAVGIRILENSLNHLGRVQIDSCNIGDSSLAPLHVMANLMLLLIQFIRVAQKIIEIFVVNFDKVTGH